LRTGKGMDFSQKIDDYFTVTSGCKIKISNVLLYFHYRGNLMNWQRVVDLALVAN